MFRRESSNEFQLVVIIFLYINDSNGYIIIRERTFYYFCKSEKLLCLEDQLMLLTNITLQKYKKL